VTATNDKEISVLLSGELAEAHERSERLARAVRTESQKREAEQEKNRRLLEQRGQLEVEVATLRVKRGHTAALLQAMRTTLQEERHVAGLHYRARAATEAECQAARAEGQLLHAQAVNSALKLARFVERVNALTLQLAALQHLHTETRARLALQEQMAQRAEQRAAKAELELETTAQAHHQRLKDVEHLEAERTRLATELESSGEALERALGRAEEAEEELARLKKGGAL
jgi:hypothetical protein